MMKTVILVCALAMSRGDCSIDSAEVVIQGPDAAYAARCGLYGQAYLAETPLAAYLDGEHYLKITCTSKAQRPMEEPSPFGEKGLAAAQHRPS